jgi:hypothetical protein
MHELRLIYESGMRAFPPRLPEQPIFYPVLNFGYAEQIARDWNTKSRSFAGYVTRFEVENGYASRFERRVVGGREHEELWVPAEQLNEFNSNIIGAIERVAAYFGQRFVGHVPQQGELAGLDAAAQFVRLAALGDDLREEVTLNHTAVFLHYPYWERGDMLEVADREQVLGAVREVWPGVSPGVALALS